MESRVALLAIIVHDEEAVSELNALLHKYGKHIVGRMGIPYREKGINIISIAIDAPEEVISALTGKIGNISGVNIKTAFSNVITGQDITK